MYQIKEMPIQERPRERFMHYGKDSLAVHELIAIIIRTGHNHVSALDLAKTIMLQFPTLKSLNQASIESLTKIKGMGHAKAIQVLAALELGNRCHKELFSLQQSFSHPNHVYDFLKHEMEMLQQEHFYALYLNTKGKLIKKECLFVGSLSASLVHPREVFKHAVTLSAASIIIAHNHPSGDPTPSQSDLKVTKALKESGELMDIEITDHIIIGKGSFYSFKKHSLV